MRIVTVALGTAVMLCSLGTFGAAAQAQETRGVREPRRVIITAPEVRPTPWDYYIIPRYRYRPEDDRIDPYGPPVVPVIRYGNQEVYIQPWHAPWHW